MLDPAQIGLFFSSTIEKAQALSVRGGGEGVCMQCWMNTQLVHDFIQADSFLSYAEHLLITRRKLRTVWVDRPKLTYTGRVEAPPYLILSRSV